MLINTFKIKTRNNQQWGFDNTDITASGQTKNSERKKKKEREGQFDSKVNYKS